MTTTIKFKKTPPSKTKLAIICVDEKENLFSAGNALDKKLSGLIKNTVQNAPKFSGKLGQTLSIALPQKSDFNAVICLGLGNAKKLETPSAETAGGKLYASVERTGFEKAVLLIEEIKTPKDLTREDFYSALALGFKLRSYKFDRYKTKKQSDKLFKELIFAGEKHSTVSKAYKTSSHVAEGVFTARDLVNEPPNTIHPPAYAKFIKKELEPLGVKIEILDDKKLKSMKMGGIMAVGQGSVNKPRIVIMQWNGAPKSKKEKAPLALVGKGVTFDTGGISIKPSAGMDLMKMDMGGSAAVVGTIKALALRKAKTNVIGIVGLAENMPSSNAYRPGDIITSYSKKTIEIMNTDAEGRLVLADCLTHVQKKFKPHTIIDLATLTGAIMVALGHEYCGTFVNNEKLWSQMEKASAQTSEKLWRMPLDDFWKKDMESNNADLQNLARTTGRYGGACTAAGFLEHFIEDGVNWAHMDIAGTAFIKSDKPTTPKFGTGFGVRVLDRLIADNYE